MKWSPLYDNSSSLCAYVSEEHIKSYLGKDKVRWNSLVDTRSKSLIRCREIDTNRPTHLEVFIVESKENERDLFWKGGVGCRLKMEKTIYI